MVYPAFHVMAGLAQLGGAALLSVDNPSGADNVAALAAEKDGRATLWLANLTAITQSVQLSNTAISGRIAFLSAEQFELAATDPNFMENSVGRLGDRLISLDAYAVARVDLDSSSLRVPW